MNKNQFKQLILESVKNNPGCKSTELIVEVGDKCKGADPFRDMPNILNEMVKEGSLREEEYTDPGMSYRVKSRWYPNS